MAPGLSRSLPAGWVSPGSAGTRLWPGTEPDISARRHRAPPWGFCRHTRTETAAAAALMSRQRSRRCAEAPPGQHIPKDGNEFSSIPAPASPRSRLDPGGAAAAPQADGCPRAQPRPFPAGFGELAHAASLDAAPSPGQEPTSELPVCRGTSSSVFLAPVLPETFLSHWVKNIHLPYFEPKGTYPSSSSPKS